MQTPLQTVRVVLAALRRLVTVEDHSFFVASGRALLRAVVDLAGSGAGTGSLAPRVRIGRVPARLVMVGPALP